MGIEWPGWLALSVVALEVTAQVVLVGRVIMQRRPVPSALSWVIVLLFLPIAGIALYFLIGENRLGARRAARSRRLTDEIEGRAAALMHHRHFDWSATDELYRAMSHLGMTIGGIPPLRGNQLELFHDTDLSLDRLIEDIDRAKDHCHLLYFIWQPDGRGMEVAEAVARAAGRGVECRVLVDAVGSRSLLGGEAGRRMREAGVKVAPALPVGLLRMLFSRVDLRNHRKIAVLDGMVAYTGSQNITDLTFKVNRKAGIGPWVDATMRIQGPAAQALQAVFLRDWLLDSDEKLERFERYAPPLPPELPGSHIVHVIPSGPAAETGTIQQAFVTAMYAAKEELILTTPYFVPDDATLGALVTAARRGVDVTLVLPRTSDGVLTAAAGRAVFGELLEAGAKIRLHHPGLLHAKTMTVDRRLAIFGSANIDVRSFYLNFETSLFIYDDDFSSVVRFLQVGYIEQSDTLTLEQWRDRGLILRFGDACARLFSPLL